MKLPSAVRWTLCLSIVCLCGCSNSLKDTANLDTPGTTIVCFGDSLTAGYGASRGQDYPAHLERLLGEPVINSGISGDTTGDALKRLERDVIEHNPRLVVILLGGNDVLQKKSKDLTESNLREIVARCTDAQAMVVLVHCKFGVLLSDPYKDAHRELSREFRTALVWDALSDILGNRSRLYDQVHPNDAGYRLLAERIAEVVEPLLELSEQSSP